MKRVILDECTPAPPGGRLTGVEALTVEKMGWKGLKNGDLVQAAERSFDILITADQNFRYRQNLSGRRIAIIELPFNSWPRLRGIIPIVQRAVETIQPGEYVRIEAS